MLLPERGICMKSDDLDKKLSPMGYRIANALFDNKDAEKQKESVIFLNSLTDNVSFFNGLTNEFDFISYSVFIELKQKEVIIKQICRCQGDTRYILNPEWKKSL